MQVAEYRQSYCILGSGDTKIKARVSEFCNRAGFHAAHNGSESIQISQGV